MAHPHEFGGARDFGGQQRAGSIAPNNIAGALAAGAGGGAGIRSRASAIVISRSGLSAGGSSTVPSNWAGVSSVNESSEAMTWTTTALGWRSAAAQPGSPQPQASRSAPCPNAPSAAERR
ncbi:hypothetical protein MMOR_12790 [Mycolicibacterium moriokaense]|uniref:Uncharacterized protein n=1 Tax=Mycolicibacterium moriokaense TaxID=39691 RepID=A0AAD1H7K2_9MYCO|nr:hypothetical protein MMOR_12790 [Mycolicibacterium moriokaense]